MLTIPVGHTLAALASILGDVDEVSSVLSTRRSTARALDTNQTLPVTAPDQVLVSGKLQGGAPLSLDYRGGMARDGEGFVWEINGTAGDIKVFGPFGHPQLVQLTIKGAKGDEKSFRPLEVPQALRADFPEEVVPGNVARAYKKMANDLREHTHTAPDFDQAVALHRVLAAIEQAARVHTPI